MEDKTFAQAIDELNQMALQEITSEVLLCWPMIQQEAAIADATAHLSNEHMQEAVSDILFYILLQSVLYNAKQHTLISCQRYKELKGYLDRLTDRTKQQPLKVLSHTI